MAATYSIDLAKAFVSLSTDDRPTGTNAGALLYETDTRLWFIFDGTNWVAYTEA
jgi:hypothetical protein